MSQDGSQPGGGVAGWVLGALVIIAGLVLVFLTLAVFLGFRLAFWATLGIPE